MVNTNVAADVLGTAKLCFAKLDNDGDALQTLVPFGISAGEIGSYQYKDVAGTTRLKKILHLDVPLRSGDMEIRVD